MTENALADRVADRAAAAKIGVAVEKKNKTIFDLIRDQQGGFAKALPSMITPERFVRVAVTAVRTNPKLAACDSMSLLGALTVCAQLGLEPGGPLGHAYLVPYGKECTFILGYRGMLALARRSGDIAGMYAECVYEGDEFEHMLGIERNIVHRPGSGDRTDDSKITHAYAVAKFRDGSDPMFIVLDRRQIEAFRARSRAKDNGPWKTDYAAMAMKTAVRRLSTWLPMSTELARAVERDERAVDRIPVDADDFIDVEEATNDDEPTVEEPEAEIGFDELESRRLTAQQLRDPAMKADPDGWKKFAGPRGIPIDSRQWTAEHIDSVIAWVTEEPEEQS